MKVLYLAPQPKRDGMFTAYSFLDEEITALAAAGVQVYVLARRAAAVSDRGGVVRWPLPRERSLAARGRSLRFLLRSCGATPAANLFSFPEWYLAARTERAAAELVAREGIDVIHSHFAWPDGFGGSLASRATGVPLIASLRGADILVDEAIAYGARERPFYDRNLRRLLRVADRTLYFSEFMRQAGIRLGALPQRARTIEKAVDLSQFGMVPDRAEARSALGLGGRPMILTVGSLIPRKGIDVLLEAAARLRNSFDFSIVICGDGPEREALGALAARLSLSDRTYFMGRVSREDIPKYFAAAEIFVLASVLEAAGNVLFEAMASACPIVCTRAGGPSEYVQDGSTGFVVPVRDSETMAERIGRLLSDRGARERLGREGRRQALTRYAYPRLVRDFVALYEEVANRPAAAAGGPCSA
jgi:glycosyltransferase involved in cell wall biosynthesis